MSSVVINLTLAAENNARMGQYIFCKETCKSNPKSSKSIQLFAALARHSAAAAGKRLLRGALGRGGGGGRTVGRALLAPVQVAAPWDVRGSGHPVAQVRRGAVGPCRESAAKALLIPGTTPIAQAIESVGAPRMHGTRGRMRRAHPESTSTGATATSDHTASPPPPPPPPPQRLEKF